MVEIFPVYIQRTTLYPLKLIPFHYNKYFIQDRIIPLSEFKMNNWYQASGINYVQNILFEQVIMTPLSEHSTSQSRINIR